MQFMALWDDGVDMLNAVSEIDKKLSSCSPMNTFALAMSPRAQVQCQTIFFGNFRLFLLILRLNMYSTITPRLSIREVNGTLPSDNNAFSATAK